MLGLSDFPAYIARDPTDQTSNSARPYQLMGVLSPYRPFIFMSPTTDSGPLFMTVPSSGAPFHENATHGLLLVFPLSYGIVEHPLVLDSQLQSHLNYFYYIALVCVHVCTCVCACILVCVCYDVHVQVRGQFAECS